MTTAFGDFIREWRGIRRYSQLQLSLEAETSARHISFLESGRAKPSRGMVLKLAGALAMPKETANQAMHAAGFAPVFPHLPMDDAALAPMRAAVDLMLENHNPYPAIAIDRHWDLVNANFGAARMFNEMGLQGATNMVDALVAAAESDLFLNWEETALLALSRLRSEIAAIGGDHILQRYADQIARHPRLKGADVEAVDFTQAIIPTIFNIDGARVALFTTIAGFGTVQDVSLSDIRIEMMFPADDAAKEWFAAT